MANRKTKPDHQTDKANLANQIARERGGAVVGLGPTRSPNTYEVQKWNGVLQWIKTIQKVGVAWKLGPWAHVAGPKAKKTGPNQSRSDKARLEPDHTRPDQG